MTDIEIQIAQLESKLASSRTVSDFLQRRAKFVEEEKLANIAKEEKLQRKLQEMRDRLDEEQKENGGDGGGLASNEGVKQGAALASNAVFLKNKNLEDRLRKALNQVREKDQALLESEQKVKEQAMENTKLQETCEQQAERIKRMQSDDPNKVDENLHNSYQQTLSELYDQINYLQDALTEAQSQNQSLSDQNKKLSGEQSPKSRGTVPVTPERGSNSPSKSVDEAMIIEKLKLRLAEANQKQERTEKELNQYRETSEEMQRKLQNEASSLKNQLIHQIQVTKFTEDKVALVTNEATIMKEELGTQVFDLEYKLENSQRTLNFIKTSAEKTHSEFTKLQKRLKELEQQQKLDSQKPQEDHPKQKLASQDEDKSVQGDRTIIAPKSLSPNKNNGMAPKTTTANMKRSFSSSTQLGGSNSSSVRDNNKIMGLQKRIFVMNKVTEMLQASISQSEIEKRRAQEQCKALSEQIEQLKKTVDQNKQETQEREKDWESKHSSMKQLVKGLVEKYNKVQKDAKQKVEKLTDENENLRSRLGKAKLVVDHLQENLANSSAAAAAANEQANASSSRGGTIPDDKVSQLESKVFDLDFQVRGLQRVKNFLENTVLKAQKKNTDLQAKIDQIEDEMKNLLKNQMSSSSSSIDKQEEMEPPEHGDTKVMVDMQDTHPSSEKIGGDEATTAANTEDDSGVSSTDDDDPEFIYTFLHCAYSNC